MHKFWIVCFSGAVLALFRSEAQLFQQSYIVHFNCAKIRSAAPCLLSFCGAMDLLCWGYCPLAFGVINTFFAKYYILVAVQSCLSVTVLRDNLMLTDHRQPVGKNPSQKWCPSHFPA